MRKKLINYINKYLKNKSVSDIINNKKGIEKVNRKGEKNMTKTFDYKSSFIKFEDDEKGIKAMAAIIIKTTYEEQKKILMFIHGYLRM